MHAGVRVRRWRVAMRVRPWQQGSEVLSSAYRAMALITFGATECLALLLLLCGRFGVTACLALLFLWCGRFVDGGAWQGMVTELGACCRCVCGGYACMPWMHAWCAQRARWKMCVFVACNTCVFVAVLVSARQYLCLRGRACGSSCMAMGAVRLCCVQALVPFCVFLCYVIMLRPSGSVTAFIAVAASVSMWVSV
jgi:hypothetical protein